MSLLAGMLAWGGAFTAFVLVLPGVSGPAHPLPAYALFNLLCLAPWTIGMFLAARRRGAGTAAGAVVQACAMLVVTYPIHVAATRQRYWDYFEDWDRLLGIRLGGVPFEEFCFYPFTINMSVLLYLWLCALVKRRGLADLAVPPARLRAWCLGAALVFAGLAVAAVLARDPADSAAVRLRDAGGVPHYAEGPRAYGWTLICLVSAAMNSLIFFAAKRRTALSLRAALPTAAVFMLVCLLVELEGAQRGWWVYNARQSSGWWIGGVPAENLVAYLTGVTLPLSLLEGTRRLLGERGLP
jgi:lycopene cyclase domain-containing protein